MKIVLQNTNLTETIGSKKRENFVIAFLEYLFMFFVILEFNSVYTEYERLNTLFTYGVIGTSFLLIFLRRKFFKIDGYIIFYFFASFLPLLNVWPGSEKRFIKYFWIILPIIFLYLQALKRINLDQLFGFILKFSNLVLLYAIISLVYWIFGSNLYMITPTMYVPNIWASEGIQMIPTYHFLYFETQHTSFLGYETIRNSGIFEEGPMYNMVLCIALATNLFLPPKIIKWRTIVLAITIATTFTTTGFIFLGLMICWVIFHLFSTRAKIMLIVILPTLAFALFNYSNTVLEDKQTSSGESSFISRTNDILTCIEIGLENPILGQGLFTPRHGENEGGTYGYSNSLFTVFADGGFYTVFLYVATLFLIPLRHFIYNIQEKWPLMFFSFFILFTFTWCQYKLLTFFFMAFGYTMLQSKKVR